MKLSCYDKLRGGEELSIEELKAAIKGLKNILSKGGVVLITVEDSLITAYNLDSYNRKLNNR